MFGKYYRGCKNDLNAKHVWTLALSGRYIYAYACSMYALRASSGSNVYYIVFNAMFKINNTTKKKQYG